MRDDNCGCSVALRTPTPPPSGGHILTAQLSPTPHWAGCRAGAVGCEMREKNPGWAWLPQRGQGVGDSDGDWDSELGDALGVGVVWEPWRERGPAKNWRSRSLS